VRKLRLRGRTFGSPLLEVPSVVGVQPWLRGRTFGSPLFEVPSVVGVRKLRLRGANLRFATA